MGDRARINKVVAVDWDPRMLRVVHAVYGKRGLSIDRMLSVAIPSGLDPHDIQAMGRHIRRTLDQEGITTKYAMVDIPRDQVILKTLNLPTTQPEGLADMVEIQIAKELPFPSADAVIDFTVGPKKEDEAGGDLLVAAIRRELLELYEAIFTAAGLKLERIGLRPHASKVAVCALLRHALPGGVLFIDVRPTFMEIDVLRDGSLAFSRSASVTIPADAGASPIISLREAMRTSITEPSGEAGVGGGSGTGAAGPSVLDPLLMEVTRSIEAYRANEPDARIDHVVVGGDIGVEEMLADAIQAQLNVTTELYNPASTFGWEPDEGAGASAFASSLGLALSHADAKAMHFDFLHPKKSESVAKRRLKKAPMVAAVVVVFATLACVVFAEYTKPDRDKLADLERRIKEHRSYRSENEKFLKLYDEIKSFDQKQYVWVDVLYDVFSNLPPNTELLVNRVEMRQKEGRLTLKTQSKHRDTPTNIILKLEAFRREGHHRPRFRVGMGPQTEKKREKYPFAQDLRIEVRNDGPADKPASGK